MLRYVILFLLLSFLTKLSGQNKVDGYVIEENGLPLEGVNVRFLPSNAGTHTDSAGYFCLQLQLPGKLKFTHVNFREVELRLFRDTTLWVVLPSLSHRLQEVKVGGQERGGVVYTSDRQIGRVPAMLGEKDVLKYIATMPGVATTDALDPGIYVRGGNSVENAFLVNDIEVANPAHLTGILSTFDPWILNRSVLYKSGFPSKYNDYLSAYINMFPEVGDRENYEGELAVGLLSSALKVRGPLKRRHTAFSLSLRTSYLQGVAKLYNKLNDSANMPSYAFYDITAAVESHFTERLSVSVFGLFTTDKLNLGRKSGQTDLLKWNTCSFNTRIRYQLPEGELNWRMGYYAGNTKADMSRGIVVGGKNTYNTFILALDYRKGLNEHWDWTGGVKYVHAGFSNGGLKQWNMGDVDFNLYKVYTALNYAPASGWKVEGGINYQFYAGDKNIGSWSPRLKISWKRMGWNLWADYATTVQYLSRFSMMNLKSPVDIWCPLNRKLKPAECRQYSLGIDKTWENGLYAYMALFWKDMLKVKDFGSVSLSDNTTFSDRQIEGTGKAKGIEWDVIYNHESIYCRVNYTLSDSWRRFTEINGGKKFYPPYDMRHNVLLAFSWQFLKKFKWNVMWCYTSGMRTTFPVGVAIAQNIHDDRQTPYFIPVYRERYNFKLPDNHRLDMSLDYSQERKKWNVLWSLGVYNLYNRQNASFVYFEPEAADKYYTRFVPHSRVLLPFIPYISVKINW